MRATESARVDSGIIIVHGARVPPYVSNCLKYRRPLFRFTHSNPRKADSRVGWNPHTLHRADSTVTRTARRALVRREPGGGIRVDGPRRGHCLRRAGSALRQIFLTFFRGEC
jgi:hypothetical protein